MVQLKVPLNNIDFIEIENQIFIDIQKRIISNWKIPIILKEIRDINFQIGKSKLDWMGAIKTRLLNELDQFDIFDVLNQIDNIIPDFLNLEEMLLLKEKFNELIESEHNYYLNDESEKDYIEGFSSALEEVSNFLGIESQSKLDLLAKKIKELEEESDQDDYSDYEYDSWRESRLENENDSSIDSLFGLLKE